MWKSRRLFVCQTPALVSGAVVFPQLVAGASSNPKENKHVNVEQEIRLLRDKDAIREIRYRFGWALDTKDWPLFESLFTPEVEADFSALGAPAKRMTPAELVGMFKHAFRAEGTRTQQLYSNFLIEVDGATATCTSYLHGQHFTPGFTGGEEFHIRAAYQDRLLFQEGRWRIHGMKLIVFFVTGNAAMIS